MKNIPDSLILDTFVASYLRHFGARNTVSDSNALGCLAESYSGYAEKAFLNLRKKPEYIRLLADSTVMMGGDALHLSTSYKEEHVSNWLRWILEAPVIPAPQRNLLLKSILSDLTASPEYAEFNKDNVQIGKLRDIKFNTEVVTYSQRRLDIVIHSQDIVIVIENKLWDKGFDKNLKYREDMRKKWGKKQFICLLLLPKDSLEDSRGAVREEVFNAFPPVTWETLAKTLRRKCALLAAGTPGEAQWAALTTAFLSFVEANVLDFDLAAIRTLIRGETRPEVGNIDKALRYCDYREDIWNPTK